FAQFEKEMTALETRRETTPPLPRSGPSPAGTSAPFDPGIFTDPALRPIGEKVLAGNPLDTPDGMALWETRDLYSLGEMADYMRRARHGNLRYYNINRHINYSNICALS